MAYVTGFSLARSVSIAASQRFDIEGMVVDERHQLPDLAARDTWPGIALGARSVDHFPEWYLTGAFSRVCWPSGRAGI